MRWLALAAAGVLVLAGCTGVPSSSAPQTIEPIGGSDPSAGSSLLPKPDAPPRDIVDGFLRAGADQQTSASAFLTAEARSRWSAGTATVVSDESTPDTYDPVKRTVTVYGRVLGTVNANGIYTPSLQGDGNGGAKSAFEFTLTQVNGQYRIDKLQKGVLLTDDQFRQTYMQRSLYFYDDAERFLVPDPRYYSALTDRAQLAEWLLSQLVQGPRPDLQNTVSDDTMPTQSDPQHITVDLGTPTRIEIPGSNQLDGDARNRLAAQVSETLEEAVAGRAIELTDGGKPVYVPAVAGTQFSAGSFDDQLGPPAPPGEVYYLSSDGRILTEAGKPVSGPLGNGSYFLDSAALTRPLPAGTLTVAATTGAESADRRLMIGTEAAGLHPAGVVGELSRPAFAPGGGEVWIGSGPKVLRIPVSGGRAMPARPVPLPPEFPGGHILALRFSPEGARVAMVVGGRPDTGGQLYVGAVKRAAGQVTIDTLVRISPQQAVIKDVSWLDSLTLFTIGSLAGSSDSRTFESDVDGSLWSTRPVNLPNAPDSVTVAAGAPAWVSANGFVWRQSVQGWVSPTGTGQTAGRQPAYLE